jgi:hypothetical protein
VVAQRLKELDACMQENAERVRQLMSNPDFSDEDLIKLWDQNTQRFNKLSHTMHMSKSIAHKIYEQKKLVDSKALSDSFKDGFVDGNQQGCASRFRQKR